MNNIIEQATTILKQGGVIMYPTDTAYGIGGRVDDAQAVSRVVNIKGRPDNKPMPILVSDITMAREYADRISPDVEALMSKYWPGGLTIVVPVKSGKVVSAVTGNTDKIGMRMPSQIELLEIIKQLGVPIIGSSANFSGHKTPFSVSELDPDLIGRVDLVVKGACGGNLASTVIDTTARPWKILRQGKVVVHEITG